MLKRTFLIFLIALSQILNAQIHVDKFDLTIESELADTLQNIYANFLNNDVDKVSIVELKKKYNRVEYAQFLKGKKLYQSRKKWIEKNAYAESIIIEDETYEMLHFDSIVFDFKYKGIDKEFIQSEIFLDSTATRMALTEMFTCSQNEIIDLCYNPEYAVIFYNSKGEVSGIYEICFECSNVKIGIIGTAMFAVNLPYLNSLFETYMRN